MPTISMFYGIIIMMYFEIKEKHHLAHIREELLADWELAKEGTEPFRIDPLK